MLSCARYVNSFKIERLFMDVFHPRTPQNQKTGDTILICPYSKSIIQHQLGGARIKNNFIISYMTMVDPDTGWFEIIEVPKFDLNKIMRVND